MSLIEARRSIIPACDVSTLEDLGCLVRQTECLEGIGGYKLGGAGGCVLRYGLDAAVEAVRQHTDLPVIFDYQKAGNDIPDMGKLFAATLDECNIEAAIVFPFAGPETAETWIGALVDNCIIPIVGAEMAHKGFAASDGGWINDNAFEYIFALAANMGVRDFVVPGNKPERVAHYHELLTNLCNGEPFALYAPGLIAQGGKISDCAKVAGDRWHAIVDRGIYEASNMFVAAREYCMALDTDQDM
jgi:orotidine-5'-phosphate decarboxylase